MPAATGETGLNISLEELSMMPVARNIEAVALLAPGTLPGDESFGGSGGAAPDRTLVSFGGASVAENVFYIDGLNVTNFRNGLGGSSVPFEFYDQFQIKTGGYGAEFGRSIGGVLNAVTKRGSNDWEYGVVTYYETQIGDNPNTLRPNGSYYDLNSENDRNRFTTDLYVGGPIIKDHLFFYVLYEPQNTQNDYNQLGSANRWDESETEDDFWGGNLTWNITDNHSLSYTMFSDEREVVTATYEFDIDSRTRGSLVGDSTDFRGGENWIASYDGQITDNLVVSAKFGKNEYNLTTNGSNDLVCPSIFDLSDGATTDSPGCYTNFTVQNGFDEREALRLDVEWYLGDHTLRAGYDNEENFSSDATVYSGTTLNSSVGGNYYFYQSWDIGDELPNGYIMTDLDGNGGRQDTVRYRYIENGGTFDTIQSAWYIEDTWQINDEFTLSVGLRNETFENNNAEGGTFIEIDDQWAPRIAFQWAPGGSGEQVVSLNWGRYHLPIAANTNVRLSGAELDYRRYFEWDGTYDPVTAAPAQGVDAEGIPVAPELGTITINSDGTVPDTSAIVDTTLDPMFQDEWILSYEREIGENWTAGIRYIRRELSSTIDDILVDFGLEAMAARGEFDGPIGSSNDCHYVLTNPGTPTTQNCEWYVVPGDPTSGTELRPTTIPAADLGFPEAERTYDAVELTFAGTIGELALQGSYTYSKNEGNTEGYVKSDIGQDDAGITQDFDIPQLMDGAFGYLPNDRRHKMKMWGSYQFDDRLSFGAAMFLQSGRPVNAFGIGHPDGTPDYGDTFYLTDPNTGEFTFVPRGSAGRTDWIMNLDVTAIYSFTLGDRATVELRGEIFNVFDAEGATEVYEFAENRPDQFLLPQRYQRPRTLRIGAAIRFE
jgi:hypothetical protein